MLTNNRPLCLSLDAPFEYNRMGEYGLPWEAGGYLMEMWAWAREFWADLAEKLGDTGNGATDRP